MYGHHEIKKKPPYLQNNNNRKILYRINIWNKRSIKKINEYFLKKNKIKNSESFPFFVIFKIFCIFS